MNVNQRRGDSRGWWLAAGLAMLLGVPVHAQTASTAPPSAPVATTATPERLISIDAELSSTTSVLKILAEKSGLNLITGPGVTDDKISVHMKQVPVDQAINLVVRAAGLAYERIGNSLLVADAKSLHDETGLSSYIVDLNYADANEVRASLKDLSEAIQVDQGGNRLIVTTSPRIIAQIRDVVRSLDVPTQQVMIEARIVEVATTAARELGVDWDQINRQSAVIVESNANSSPPGELPDQIPFVPMTGKFQPFYRQAYNLRATLDLLVQDGNARVLATPRLVTLNGKEAWMLAGRRIPYETSQTVFAGNAAAPTTSIQKEEVGVKLRVTALINADGYITTTISPEVSSVVGFVGRNGDLPEVATREATTTVRLRDGDSVIIGGLLLEEETKNVTKLPILGDIPFIGVLFQHHSSTLAKRDLVIEVTPHILAPAK